MDLKQRAELVRDIRLDIKGDKLSRVAARRRAMRGAYTAMGGNVMGAVRSPGAGRIPVGRGPDRATDRQLEMVDRDFDAAEASAAKLRHTARTSSFARRAIRRYRAY